MQQRQHSKHAQLLRGGRHSMVSIARGRVEPANIPIFRSWSAFLGISSCTHSHVEPPNLPICSRYSAFIGVVLRTRSHVNQPICSRCLAFLGIMVDMPKMGMFAVLTWLRDGRHSSTLSGRCAAALSLKHGCF
jgi:hypothetical protein